MTVLGHVQRGGLSSAFDRNLGTMLGSAAVETLLTAEPDSPPQLIGMRGNRITLSPLMECVAKTHAVADAIANHEYEKAMDLRGSSFNESFLTLKTMLRTLPHPLPSGQKRLRLGVIHAGAPCSGNEYRRPGGSPDWPGSAAISCSASAMVSSVSPTMISMRWNG